MTQPLATLVVYAYTSFASIWGAGPEIVKKFETKCSCHVTLVDVGDAGAILSRLKLEGDKTKADVVIGFDDSNLWRLKKDLHWDNAKTQAYDHGPLAFVYNSKFVKNPPQSLDDLLDPRWKGEIVVEDPRLSTVATGFLLWVIREKGEEGAWHFFRQLKPNLKLIAPSWDLAYGVFKKNQAKLVLSYWTSPAYHIQEEKDDSIKAAIFSSGQYVQTEYAAINPRANLHKNNLPKSELSDQFMEFLLSPDAQGLIPEKNFMYPENSKAQLSSAFKKLGVAKEISPLNRDLVAANLNRWLGKWREIFSE